MKSLVSLVCLTAFVFPSLVARGDAASYTGLQDVVYGRTTGTALTMDVFTPNEKANGATVVIVVSGGFFSSHDAINPGFAQPFLDRGYTVFAIINGSPARFPVP